MNEILRLEKISKVTQKANVWNINFNLYEGEIHAIISRNNALNNVLNCILIGEMQPDKGIYYLYDRKESLSSIEEAHNCGIYSIRKSSKLFENLSLTDNLFLNRKSEVFRDDKDKIALIVRMIIDKYGMEGISPSTKVRELSNSMKHMVECLKAVSSNAKILIVDNITSTYTPFEVMRFKQLLQKLSNDGISIIMIFNSYSDLLSIADRAAIVRGNTICSNLYGENITREQMFSALSGSPINTENNLLLGNYRGKKRESYIISAKELSSHGLIKDLNLDISKGTSYGILDTGSEGWKQLIQILTIGEDYTGQLLFRDKPYKAKNYISAISQGVGLIDARDDDNMCFQNLDLVDNITVMAQNIKKGFIESPRIRKFIAADILRSLEMDYLLEKYPDNVKLNQIDLKTQFEISVARLMCTKVKLIILVHPDLYYDDFNMVNLKKLIINACKRGITFLVISPNINNLSYMCNKISVMD